MDIYQVPLMGYDLIFHDHFLWLLVPALRGVAQWIFSSSIVIFA